MLLPRPVRVLIETVVLIVLAIAVAVVVKAFFVQSFYIPSGSMEPGLQVNDRILVEKVSYWHGKEPQHGDVIVFDDPGDWLSAEEAPAPTGVSGLLSRVGLYPGGGHLVKRVIGLPGDTVVCCDAKGQIQVDGVSLDESGYIAKQPVCNGPMAGCEGWSATVPKGMLFVMGDNRGDSADSSLHLAQLCADRGGPEGDCNPAGAFVPEKDVVGKVAAVVWPWSRHHEV